MELDSHLNPVDTFSIVLDSTLSQLHQELPSTTDQVQPLLKDVFSVKPEESKYQKSQSQTQNLIQLMDQLDPMLSWDVLAQKILSKYSILEDVIERTKAKPCQNDPIQFSDFQFRVICISVVSVDKRGDCISIYKWENLTHLQSSGPQLSVGSYQTCRHQPGTSTTSTQSYSTNISHSPLIRGALWSNQLEMFVLYF